jgi:hypothetical protein
MRGTTGRGPAKELDDLLESLGVSVWFSEKDVVLGSPLREIDKGLAKSRVGIVPPATALQIAEDNGMQRTSLCAAADAGRYGPTETCIAAVAHERHPP